MNFKIIDIREKPVFWINMDSATDRRDIMQAMLDNRGFKNVTRVSGVVSEHGKPHGNARAFRETLKVAPNSDFIILEDDAVETINYNPLVRIPEDTDAFYLGISGYTDPHFVKFNKELALQTNKLEGEDDIFRIRNMLSKHAIYYGSEKFVNACNKGLDELIAKCNPDLYSDVLWGRLQTSHNIYCNKKPIFYQPHWKSVTDIILED